MQAIIVAVCSFVLAVVFGKLIIPALRALHAGQLFQRTVQPRHARGALHVQNSQRNVFHLLRPQVKRERTAGAPSP